MRGENKSNEPWDRKRIGLLAQICEFKKRHNGPLKQNKIAEKLGIREPQVSTIFNDGIRDGLVEVTFKPPLDFELESQLAEALVQAGRKITRIHVGQPAESTGHVAARYFEENVKSGKTVVLDGGLTVRDFVRDLNLPKDLKLNIIAIAADPPSYITSAYELMTLLSVKLPLSRCEKLPHFGGDVLADDHKRVIDLAKEANYVFVGAGPCEATHTALDFVKYLGVPPEKFKREHDKIAFMCGYCGLDEHGKEVKFLPYFDDKMPRALKLEDLQSMAKDPDKVIALLAKGETKLAAVTAVIKARMVNTLFLDAPLATALLKNKDAFAG